VPLFGGSRTVKGGAGGQVVVPSGGSSGPTVSALLCVDGSDATDHGLAIQESITLPVGLTALVMLHASLASGGAGGGTPSPTCRVRATLDNAATVDLCLASTAAGSVVAYWPGNPGSGSQAGTEANLNGRRITRLDVLTSSSGRFSPATWNVLAMAVKA